MVAQRSRDPGNLNELSILACLGLRTQRQTRVRQIQVKQSTVGAWKLGVKSELNQGRQTWGYQG